MSNNVQRKKSMEVRYHEIKLWEDWKKDQAEQKETG